MHKLDKALITRMAVEEGLSPPEMAERLGESARRIRLFCHNNRIPYNAKRSHWTDERLAIARRLRAEGKSFPQIADALGCSIGSVVGKLYEERERGGKGGSEPARPPIPLNLPPPSPAMVRLAQFDPVVRRALNRRLGIIDPLRRRILGHHEGSAVVVGIDGVAANRRDDGAPG